jgi:thiamine-phosphate pyrophosphorylase
LRDDERARTLCAARPLCDQRRPRGDLVETCAQALEGGARVLQYRDKTRDASRRLDEARALQSLCARFAVPLIVNDDVELAAAIGAAGVHLGEDDDDLAPARARLGAQAIIGVSCYDSLERAPFRRGGRRLSRLRAFFPSPTKPHARRARLDLLRDARARKPLVAIGGITIDNASSLIEAGADGVAVISALFGAKDVRSGARLCFAVRRDAFVRQLLHSTFFVASAKAGIHFAFEKAIRVPRR